MDQQCWYCSGFGLQGPAESASQRAGGFYEYGRVLTQSAVGDHADLRRFGIPLVQHLPGVGQNFQDHVGVANAWEIPKRTVDAALSGMLPLAGAIRVVPA